MTEYIEREAIIKQLCLTTACSYYGEVVGTIIEFPAADVQPVKRGEWIDLDNRILCSACGAGYDDTDDVKFYTYNFCPNCGADMRGDTE